MGSDLRSSRRRVATKDGVQVGRKEEEEEEAETEGENKQVRWVAGVPVRAYVCARALPYISPPTSNLVRGEP